MDPLNKTTTDEPSNENVASKGRCFVAVHAGAGYHSKKHGKEYRTAMKAACAAAMHALCNGKEASDAVEAAIMELEDATATNAGVGSNLNRLGLVECDASIMTSAPSDAFGAVGAVGAVADIRNPIQGANAVRKAYAQGPDSSGLVPPMMLAGRGADLWAREQGVLMDPHNRFKITEDALARYSAYMERVEGAAERDKTNAEAIHVDEAMLMDTVGAVCIDVRGGVASGVSSGGIALKIPGRIGEASITIGRAAMFGCGCWAELAEAKGAGDLTFASGCSVSGTGEQISRTLLAMDCARRTDDMFTALEECFKSFNATPVLSRYERRSAGVIFLRQSTDAGGSKAELGVAHTTHSMGYGYMTDEMDEPKAMISRKTDDSVNTVVLATRL